MTVEERTSWLEVEILHFTKDLLHFDVVEVRLLDAKTGRLDRSWPWVFCRKRSTGISMHSRRTTA